MKAVPWILVALLLAVVLWFLWRRGALQGLAPDQQRTGPLPGEPGMAAAAGGSWYGSAAEVACRAGGGSPDLCRQAGQGATAMKPAIDKACSSRAGTYGATVVCLANNPKGVVNTVVNDLKKLKFW